MSEEVVTEVPTEVQDATPATTAQEPVESVQQSGTEQATEKPVEQPKPKSDWVQRRIDQLVKEKHEATRRAEDAESRLRQSETPTEPAQQSMSRTEIEKAAEQLVKQREFDSACNKVFEAGKSEFSDFEDSLKTFSMLGGAPRDFLETLTALDNGHKVLRHLGNNPELAEKLLNLSPVKQAVELAKLDNSLASQVKTQTKAPPPINPLGGKSVSVDPSEFKTTAEYIEWRRKQKQR
jgi:hypothetical protein